MKNKIPIALIYLRVITGIILLLLSVMHVSDYCVIAVVLLAVGLLSDIFDGIIARQLGISTQKLRRLDSTADQIFWLLVAASVYIQCPQFFKSNYVMLIILFASEALTYVISFIKFKKEVATHAIASKLWVLTIFATLVQVMLTCNEGILFTICFYLGIITRFEIVAILLLLKQWTNDVPSVYHAVQLRKGKPIKRKKLFNG